MYMQAYIYICIYILVILTAYADPDGCSLAALPACNAEAPYSTKKRNTALTLAHAQTIQFTSN